MTVFLGLFQRLPEFPEDAGNELRNLDYHRADFGPVVEEDGAIVNKSPIEFVEAHSKWGEIVGLGLYNELVGGRIIVFCRLDRRQTIFRMMTIRFEAGCLRI